MRRHSIIARLGPTDKTRVVPRDTDTVKTTIRFVDGDHRLGFGLGQMIDQLADLGLTPTERAVDLAIFSAVVMAADTRISRATESQDSWTREIDLYLPVLEPEVWTPHAALIERMLRFLTGDHWRLTFRRRHRDYRELVEQAGELNFDTFDSVCLFSGGLDSFVGAIDLLAEDHSPLFVSHYGDVSTSTQTECAEGIGAVYGDLEPRHVRANIGFPADLVEGSGPELTTRGRSFLFLALAALAASALEDSTIYIPENGLISLNVPLDPLRLGAWSTRTTHPFYLARWQQLIDALGISASIKNPYRFMTKAEMLKKCRNRRLAKRLAPKTISCSSFGKARYRSLSPRHCGYCTPCLIRRAAIESAFGTDRTLYSIRTLRLSPWRGQRPKASTYDHFR
ncbi:Qat anti-phage system QueC-like protein QatC [Bradyrhizobium sp. CCBAU 45321]|uniref:Qat anti-phage system QueC-like protein QatC n=1 Tax=Bradyrhizobium sp. CCBAU 45321 TaxID=1641878 RepID=UPI0023042B5B|nr:Qat anti-phage system QueC-like protein QatC [Bradyrhizobium sp. CCBAU 45321]